MEKIDIDKIRGKYITTDLETGFSSGGDDTVQSLKLLASKINDIVEEINKINSK